jgi:RNA polymerase sigma factor (sigma-70 family)
VAEREGTQAAKGGGSAPESRALHVVRAGDAYGDWEELYADNVVRVYRLLYSKVGNKADAEDLTTEVFLAAYGPLRLEASRGEVRAYLARTAHTVLASFWRRRLGREITAIDLDAAEQFLEQPPPDGYAARRAQHILGRLPARSRRILELRFLERQSLRDSADAMGITVGNAKVLQHRALRMAAQVGEDGA